MKHLLLVLFLVISFHPVSFAQEESSKDVQKEISECIDRLGYDTSASLNECECRYLDYFFQKNKGSFGFCGTKVYFLTGNLGRIEITKKAYFEDVKQILREGMLPSLGMQQLVIFDEYEAKVAGYEAIIIVGSKKYITKKEIIKQLKK